MNCPFSSFNNGIQHVVEIQKPKKALDIAKFDFIKEVPAHKSLITCLLFLKDKRVATGSQDANIKFFETKDFKCQLEIPAHESGVTHLSQAENGIIISCSCDFTIKLWEVNFKCFRNIGVLSGHLRWVNCAAPIGIDSIVSCSDDQTVMVWDVVSHKATKTIEFDAVVPAVHKLNNYNTVVAFSGYKVATFMNIEDNFSVLKTIPDVQCYLNNSFVETGDNKLVVGGVKVLSIIDLQTLKVVKKIENNCLSYVGSMVLLDSSNLVLGCLSSFFQFNMENMKCNGKKEEEHITLVNSMVFYKEHYLVSASKNNLKLWKVNK